MERRRLGRTDMVASVLGFGGSEIGYDRVAVRTVARLLGSALDAGLNVIDTAECYEDGEALIGKAVGSRRRDFYLLTKCGHPRGWGRGDWRPASLLASIERSLKRLDYRCGRDTPVVAAGTALRFTLSVPGIHTAIVGTAKAERWQENAKLLEAGALLPNEFDAIRARWREMADTSWEGQV